jgi:hypothetical protein
VILLHPATLGTIAWALFTLGLIALFGGRGVSAVWGISSSIARGVRDWSRGSDASVAPTVSPRAVELPPLPTPTGRPAAARGGRVINAGAAARWRAPEPEVEELPRRRLD